MYIEQQKLYENTLKNDIAVTNVYEREQVWAYNVFMCLLDLAHIFKANATV